MGDLRELQEAVVVRPGDTLVVRVPRDITMDEAARFRGQMEARLPGVEVAIVAADQMLVYRPDGGEHG